MNKYQVIESDVTQCYYENSVLFETNNKREAIKFAKNLEKTRLAANALRGTEGSKERNTNRYPIYSGKKLIKKI